MRKLEYQAPVTLDDALILLDRYNDSSHVLAGGTDLILGMKTGQISPRVIIDIKKIPELHRLEWDEKEGLHIGAAVPLSKLIKFEPLHEKFGILVQACSLIGSVQIRNRATMGGNICNAAPCADSPPPLLCLDAKAIVASRNGSRTIPIEDFFEGPSHTALNPDELLVEVIIPTPSLPSAGCYLRHTTREEMDITVAGVGAFLVLSPQEGTFLDARIALGAVAPTPVRAIHAEAVLKGKVPALDYIDKAVEAIEEDIQPISDLRGSADYRIHISKVLTRRTLIGACRGLDIDI